MELKILPKPSFTKEQFVCDVKIHEKLKAYPMIDEHMSMFHTTVFLGNQGSGKTSLMLQLLKKIYKKCFNRILVVMPPTSRNSIKNSIFDKLPKGQIYDELTPETMNDIYEKVKINSEKNEYTLIIFDDVQKNLRNYEVMLSFQSLVANQRHLKVCSWVLIQNYFKIDPTIRELINNLIVFKVKKKQFEKIFDECIETHADKFVELLKFVYDDPTKHQFMFINIKSQKIYKGFDQVIFKDDEKDKIELQPNEHKETL